MRKVFASRTFKYVVYCLGLLFVCLFVPGAHDEAFFQVLLGVLIGNLIFSIWILPWPLYASIPTGLFVPNVAIFAAFRADMLFVGGSPPASALLFWFFASVFSILTWEGAVALVRLVRA
jgi:hypothetical protein